MKKNNQKLIFFLILLLSLSLFFHFLKLSQPQKVIFDEQWYASDATSYFTHKYYFDVHPPLGKLLIAGSGYIFGFEKPQPGTGFSFRFGDTYPNIKNYLPFRILPAILGSLLPILGFLIVKEFGGSDKASFLAAIFLLFDTTLLLQSRLILLEFILVFFSLLSVFLYLKLRKQKKHTKKWYLFLSLIGFSLGATISVKWTGIIILFTIIFLEILRLDDEQREKKEKFFKFLNQKKREMGLLFLGIFILPLLVYVFSFYIHFSLLTISRDPKDIADPLMYGKKEETENLPQLFYYEIPKGNFFEKFIKTQKKMTSVLGVTGSHPYSSEWWEWPLGVKPILYYWQGDSRLYLIPNPIVWFFSLLGIFMVFLIPLYKRKNLVKSPSFFSGRIILYFYFFSWLFFVGLSRTSFLYYYLTPLCFSIIIFALCFDFYTQKLTNKKTNLIWGLLILACFIAFVIFASFTYGLPLSQNAINIILKIPF